MNDEIKSEPVRDAEPLLVEGHRPDLGSLILGGAFLAFLAQHALTAGSLEPGLLFMLAWLVFVQAMVFLAWLRPPRIALDGGRIQIRLFPLQKTLQTDVVNVAALGILSRSLVLRFHDLQRLDGITPATVKQLEANAARTRFHLQLPGGRFDIAQVNQIRHALGCGPQEPSSIELETQAFEDRLGALTHRPWVTIGLIVTNVVVFLLMQTQELGLWEPTVRSLLNWGANYGPRTLSGDWWRLLSHQFVHIGLLHLLFNMSVLKQTGPTAERLLGSELFLVGYVFSGVCGGLCSLAWSTNHISAGASGAIFGVFGMILGLLARHHRTLPMDIVKQHRDSIVLFVLFNVYFSFSIRGIDIGAHLGGLVGGFVFGLAVVPVFLASAVKWRVIQVVPVTIAGVLLSIAGFRQLVPVADLPQAMQRVFETEQAVVKSLDSILTRINRAELPPADAGVEIRRRVVEPWHAARQEFEELDHVRPEQRDQVQAVAEYMKLREDEWRLMADAMAGNDLGMQGEAALKGEAAFDVLKAWSAANPGQAFSVTEAPRYLATELAVFVAVSQRAAVRWDQADQSRQAGAIDDMELVRRIQRDCRPELEAARSRFRANAETAIGANPAVYSLVLKYADAQLECWDLQVKALTTHDEGAIQQYKESEQTTLQLWRQLSGVLAGQAAIDGSPSQSPL